MLLKLGQIQAAIFLTHIQQSARLKIASQVIEAVPGLSGVDPIIFPLPQDAPPEAPQIIIQNAQTRWSFQFAPARCDLFYNPQQHLYKLDDFSQALEVMQDSVLRLWNALESGLSAYGNRLGLVVHFETETENAVQELRHRYINPELAHDAKEIQFHYLRNIQREDFDLNCWVRLRNQPKQEEMPEAILMHVDVNTVAEQPLERVDSPTIQEFLRLARELVEENLELHLGAIR